MDSCTRCSGSGRVNHSRCDSFGYVQCDSCYGRGRQSCTLCSGTGYSGQHPVYRPDGLMHYERTRCTSYGCQNGQKTCDRCSGRGNRSCPDHSCSGGKVECSSCGGTGRNRNATGRSPGDSHSFSASPTLSGEMAQPIPSPITAGGGFSSTSRTDMSRPFSIGRAVWIMSVLFVFFPLLGLAVYVWWTQFAPSMISPSTLNELTTLIDKTVAASESFLKGMTPTLMLGYAAICGWFLLSITGHIVDGVSKTLSHRAYIRLIVPTVYWVRGLFVRIGIALSLSIMLEIGYWMIWANL